MINILDNKKNNNKETYTSAGRIYFPELDGLRFFAFILVFIHHSPIFSQVPYLSFLFSFGWIGVDLFFVLSAFLFTKLLIEEYRITNTISFKKFYVRRIFRIWPIYFLFIPFSLAYFVFLQHGTITKYIILRTVGLFTFTDNIMAATSDYNPIPITSHLWTISYEEQFYVFIPLIILALVRSSFKLKAISMTVIFILLNIIRILFIKYKVPHPAIWVLPITHFDSIFMGIIIGFGGLNSLLKKINPLLVAFAGIALFIFLSVLPNIVNISYWLIALYSLVGVSTSCILYSVLKSDYLKRIFSNKVFVYLGKRSYGLYLYHLFGSNVTAFAIKHIFKMTASPWAVFLYSLFFTILVSIVSYNLIEKPFLVFKKKFEIIASRPV